MSIPTSEPHGTPSQADPGGAGGGQRVSTTRARKIAEVEELSQKLRGSQGILLADYRGLKVRQMGELRRRLREAQADMSVVKNALLRLALERLAAARQAGDVQAERPPSDRLRVPPSAVEGPLAIPEQMLEGPTAVIFCGKDVVLAAKAVSAFAREHRLPVLKGGHIEGKAIEAAQALELATLPPRQEIMARLVGLVARQTPAGLLVSSLQAVLGRFVATLSAHSARPPAGGSGGPAAGAQASAQTAGAS